MCFDWCECYLDLRRRISEYGESFRMIGVIVKIALLVHFLFSIAEVSGQSPCPNYFWYARDDGTNEIVGFVEIPSPPRGVTLDLSVSLSIAVALPSKYVGRLELAQSKEDSVRAVNVGRPLRYKIHFPLPQPIPILTGIRFNGQFVCSGPRATGQIVTSIVLNHTLYPPGVLPLSQDQGNMIIISDYNVPIRNDAPFSIGPKPENNYYPRPPAPSVFDNYPRPPASPTFDDYPRPPASPTFDNYPRPSASSPFDNNPRPPASSSFDINPQPPVSSSFDNNPRPPVSPSFDNNPRPPASPSFNNYPPPSPSPKPMYYPKPPRPTSVATTTTPAPKPEDNNLDCGRSDVKGINRLVAKGSKTSHGQWPWLAAIFIVRPTYEFQCEGTLVTNNHVITAAHCFQLNNMNLPIGVLAVSLGRHRLRNFLEEGSRNMEVAEYRLHPDYDASGSADADLGIIFLRERVEYSRWIKPICLWSGSTELQHVVGKSGYVVGWGRDENGNQYIEEPRMSKAPIVSHAVCFWSNPNFVSFTSNRTFCAGSRDGSGPCNGDSGSGFVMYDTDAGRYYLRGIVSGSLLDSKTMSCDLSQFIVYVDVAKHLDWIRKQIYT
ncbi:spermosin-like isoform X2 [Ceratina calcarata]|uniref:Spermosin-like isoform X2 n=1 Tax=Ceratina calcarata TaxID=156304 RepID=A0AAJ7ISU9_9HYME|nr:spermosin-like isoform X2 [Ceratina calcarata]